MWEDLILSIEGQVSWILCRNFWYTNRKWVFPDIGVPQNGWFTMEDPIFYWTIWGENPLFSETSKCMYWICFFCSNLEASVRNGVFFKCFWSVSDKGGPECMKQMNDSFWCFSFSEECMVRIMPFHQTGRVKVAEEKPEKSPTRAGVSDFKYPKWPENSEGFVFFIYRKLWSSSYSVLFAGLVRLLPEVNWWWRWVFCNHRKMSTEDFQWE